MMRRREALAGALLAAVAPSEALAAPDPHMAWLEEWRELDRRFSDADDGDMQKLVADMASLMDLIEKTPAQTPAGMMAKIDAVNEDILVHLDGYEDVRAPKELLRQIKAFLGRA